MKEYIDYLMTKLKTDIECFTIFSDGSIRIELNSITDIMSKLVIISAIIKDIITVEIEDFDSDTTSILFKVKNERS